MTEQETLYTIALTLVPSLSLANLHQLIDGLGSATAIYENRRSLGELLPAAQKKTLAALAAMDSHLSRAEEEMLFCQTAILSACATVPTRPSYSTTAARPTSTADTSSAWWARGKSLPTDKTSAALSFATSASFAPTPSS